ncbi:MAG: aldo/keto reductase [Ktedonobacteraceae bacterium]
MKTRQFGNTDMQITPIGFGSWAVGGGGYQFGWGPQDDVQSIAAIQHSLDLGINWIDTAAVYGLGHAEEVVARALKDRSERPYIFTKCTRVWNDRGEISGNLKAQSIKRECENSLRRLQTDVIDLYQVHWPDPEQDIEEGWGAMAELKREGKVRYIGVSNFNVSQMRRAMEIAPISSLQPPFSLVKPDIQNEILPFCLEHNIGVIVYSPMASGLLTRTMTSERITNLPEDDWRKRDPQFKEPRLSRNLKLVEQLNEIAFMHNVTPGVVAIAWAMQHPGVIGAIVGARRPEQVDGIVAAAEFRLTDSENATIDNFLKENP